MPTPIISTSTHIMCPSPDAQVRIHDGCAFVTAEVGVMNTVCLSGDPAELAATLRAWVFAIELADLGAEAAA